jgi:hypothetical protein
VRGIIVWQILLRLEMVGTAVVVQLLLLLLEW